MQAVQLLRLQAALWELGEEIISGYDPPDVTTWLDFEEPAVQPSVGSLQRWLDLCG